MQRAELLHPVNGKRRACVTRIITSAPTARKASEARSVQMLLAVTLKRRAGKETLRLAGALSLEKVRLMLSAPSIVQSLLNTKTAAQDPA